jgi:hypothetical protein
MALSLAQVIEILTNAKASVKVIRDVAAAWSASDETQQAKTIADAKAKREHINALTAERMRKMRLRNVTRNAELLRVTPPNKEALPPTPPYEEIKPPEDNPLLRAGLAPPPTDFPDLLGNPAVTKANGHPVSKLKPNPAHVYDLDFETLWGTYPRHDGNKRRSETEWLRLPVEDRDKALDAALLYRATIDAERVRKGDPRTPCRHLEYFLKDRHFDTLLEQSDGQ